MTDELPRVRMVWERGEDGTMHAYVHREMHAAFVRAVLAQRFQKLADTVGYYVSVAQNNDDTQAMKALDLMMHAIMDTEDAPSRAQPAAPGGPGYVSRDESAAMRDALLDSTKRI